ncbi:ATP-binding protein [uncultured Sphingomonas sp.]|uniref:ATP-binding protein n=1 Tax=uncultured Sphingomonas sp. TaxID=158754 RepID=UPI0025DE097A|nr:ATP-binding protein [uncultured Sphingomonas sp.]
MIGQVFAILLLTILIEFAVSTVLYERASQFAVRDDEARRLAEHLVIARKLLAEQPPARREGLALEFTTSRYEVRWMPALPPALREQPDLDRLYEQVVLWEPSLAQEGLRLRLTSQGSRALIVGAVPMPDGSWMYFRTREQMHAADLGASRVLLALAPALALILISGVLLRRMLLPMRRLAVAADRFGAGSVVEVQEAGPKELRRVISAFNRMQARIQRLIADRTQALAAVGHDMRTPLARLRLRADAIADPDVHAAVETDITEMEAMISSLLAFLGGEGDKETPARVDLAVLCATIADDNADHGRDVEYEGPDHFEHVVRPLMLKRALNNLVDNAVHYAGQCCIRLATMPGGVAVRVEDRGPGIPEEDLQRVMQPFVRLDAARSRDTVGFGLGLSIVARAAEAEGGSFRLTNRAGGGLCAEILLPRDGSSA